MNKRLQIDFFMLTCQMKVACSDLYICKHPKAKVDFQLENVFALEQILCIPTIWL